MKEIKTDDLEEMVQICAELTRQGITFESTKSGGTWVIECKGY